MNVPHLVNVVRYEQYSDFLNNAQHVHHLLTSVGGADAL